MLERVIAHGLWPATMAGIAVLGAAAQWRRKRLVAVGAFALLPLFAYLFVAGPGGWALAVLLGLFVLTTWFGVRADDRPMAWAGVAATMLTLGWLFASG